MKIETKVILGGTVVMVMVAAIYTILAVRTQPNTAPATTTQVSQPLPILPQESLLQLTNEYRASKKLASLTEDPEMDHTAQVKCDYMEAHDYWAHDEPGGRTWQSFMKPHYLKTGENLALDYHDNRTIMMAWENSPEHNANLLNPAFNAVGFAMCDGQVGHITVQQLEQQP